MNGCCWLCSMELMFQTRNSGTGPGPSAAMQNDNMQGKIQLMVEFRKLN